jgi:protein involved in ribonucleotide reduction
VIVYYSSRSENTARFAAKLDAPSIRIPINDDPPHVDKPYLLIVPTYSDAFGSGAVPRPVIRFLNVPENRALCRGVIGGGNRNFGALFAIGARVVAQRLSAPLLHRLELSGDARDVEIVNRLVKEHT